MCAPALRVVCSIRVQRPPAPTGWFWRGSPTAINRAPEASTARSSRICSRVDASAASSWITVVSGVSSTRPCGDRRVQPGGRERLAGDASVGELVRESFGGERGGARDQDLTATGLMRAGDARSASCSCPVPACPSITTSRCSPHASSIAARCSSDRRPPVLASSRSSRSASRAAAAAGSGSILLAVRRSVIATTVRSRPRCSRVVPVPSASTRMSSLARSARS